MPSTPRVLLDFLGRPERHRYGPHRCHRADLHVPTGQGPFPVVVTIHGGYWRARYSKLAMKAVAADLARRDRLHRQLAVPGSPVPAVDRDDDREGSLPGRDMEIGAVAAVRSVPMPLGAAEEIEQDARRGGHVRTLRGADAWS